MYRKIIPFAVLGFFLFPFLSKSQDKEKKEDNKPEFKFTVEKELKSTVCKNQYKTGTCWSFAVTSFLESELLRLGKEEFDLSEMYFVRNIYPKKALRFVRLHGKTVFGQGGQAHDVFNIIDECGIVPEKVYEGRNYGETLHNHEELEAILTGMMKGLLKNEDTKLTLKWKDALEAVLDVYLGELPKEFIYKDKSYTPQSFAKDELKINPSDYIELTSYNHHPFYSKFDLEIPDNWSHDQYYNVPLDDLLLIVENAINNGYSVCWDGDISNINFLHANGYAIVPEQGNETMTTEQLIQFLKGNSTEMTITQELRQSSFDDHSATDDHLMHITGISKDQNGNHYFITKNSWGSKSNGYQGYLHMSVSYFKLNTIAILLHKDAIPSQIAKKLKI